MNRCEFIEKMALAVATACGVLSVGARTFEVSAWRGETLAALVEDFVEFGEPPEGVSVRFGVLKSVKYAPAVRSLERKEVYDRVVWNADDEGPRVVEISVPADAKSGVYTCGQMNIRVIDRVLPPARDWKYVLDLWQHPWAVARWAKATPFSKGHYAAMRPLWELLASAGQKSITVTILEQPWDHQCYDAYHSMMTDDFKLFDEYVEFCRDCGLGPYISCYSLCPWSLGKAIDVQALETRWVGWLEKFAAHLKEKGWYDVTYMSMDEREPDDVRTVVEFVQRHAPGMKVSMAGNRKPSDFKGIRIDSYAQILLPDCVTKEFLDEAAERRRRGLVTTFYTCCAPGKPNTFMSSGAGEAFWLGAYPAVVGLDGFLRWAWNSWPQNPKKDATYWNWNAGDTFLCYPDGEPSWRFLELRNGIVAAEKIRILRDAGALDEKEFEKISGLFDVKRATGGCLDFLSTRKDVMRLVNSTGTRGAAIVRTKLGHLD